MAQAMPGRREFLIGSTAAIVGCAAGSKSFETPTPPARSEAYGGRRYGPFRGMMPIMATPVDNDLRVDETSQRRHVEYCIQCGAVAVGHFAYASEFQKITDADRSRLLDLVVEQVNGRVPFFAGVTGKTRDDMLRYAREAEVRGADLIMPALPYEEDINQAEAHALFLGLAEATALPMIIQDTAATAHILTPEFISRIAQETGQVHSIKAESPDFLTKTKDLLEHFDGELQVIGGAGGQHMIHLLRLGATAFMTGTEALEFHAETVSAYLAGDVEHAAFVYYNKILPYFMFYSSGNWLRNLKMMLHMRGIIDTPHLLPPDDTVPPAYSETVLEEYRWALDHIGWTKMWPNIP